MKQRIISGAIIAAITIAVVLLGGNVFKLICALIAIQGTREFICAAKGKHDWKLFVVMLLTIVLIFCFNQYGLEVLLLELLTLLAICVFDEKESFTDIAVTFMMSVLLGYSLYYLNFVENHSKWLMGYIIIIAYLTDVFALFTGMKFGKHKLNERISPKKTIEGAIGGWIIGGIVSLIYAFIFNFFDLGALVIIISSICLPIISQVGDLVYSAIKRFYGIKDFSNLIPGHGGILDRLDSLTFTVTLFGIIIKLFA